jgi:hypothetical protein
MDLQVIYMHDVLQVTSVDNVVDTVPRTLDIRGPEFRNVVRVELNEVMAPNFVVVSLHQILVQVPANQEKEVIRSIAVLSSGFTSQDNSQLSFEISNFPRGTSGLMKMIQNFVLYLMRSPGTDAWYPRSGGGVLRFAGASFSKNTSGGLIADFTLSVNRTRTQIMGLQANNPRLSSDEKLAAANVLSAVYSSAQSALLARVELIAQSGRRAAIGLEL